MNAMEMDIVRSGAMNAMGVGLWVAGVATEAVCRVVVYFVMELEPRNVTFVMVEEENTISFGEDTKNVSIVQAEALIVVFIARVLDITFASNVEVIRLFIAMNAMELERKQLNVKNAMEKEKYTSKKIRVGEKRTSVVVFFA